MKVLFRSDNITTGDGFLVRSFCINSSDCCIQIFYV
jgi:CUB domain